MVISKESAQNISSKILNSEYESLRAKRKKAFNLRYGRVLDNKLILEYGDKPETIDRAIRYSHSRWQVLLAACVWLSIPLFLIFTVNKPNIAALLLIILSGGLAVARLAKHYIKIYLSVINKNA